MTDRPIIFSAPMIRALLDGRKTMTRRLAWVEGKPKTVRGRKMTGFRRSSVWQDVQPCDRLWVRETWMPAIDAGGSDWRYAANYDPDGVVRMKQLQRWNPSIHMPRRASRITLVVEAARVERLQDISEDDAEAEGLWRGRARRHLFWNAAWECRLFEGRRHQDVFAELWGSLHGDGAWEANPEVVALTFRVVKANIDSASARKEIA